jgi:hypothetical protein
MGQKNPDGTPSLKVSNLALDLVDQKLCGFFAERSLSPYGDFRNLFHLYVFGG